MYLASLDTEDAGFVQGMLEMPGPPGAPLDLRTRWWDTYRRLLGDIRRLAPAGVALRVGFDPGAGVHQALIISASRDEKDRLRQFLAPFTRLETVAPGSGRFPVVRDDYDSIADRFPGLRCRLAVSAGELGGAWFACDFHLAGRLDALMLAARDHEYRLGYQINLRPLTAPLDVDTLRAARRNALTVAELPGVPAAVIGHQRELADRMTEAWAAYEEYVGVDTPEAAEWLAGALQREYREQFSTQRFDDSPEWWFEAHGYEDELAYPLLFDPHAMSLADLSGAVIPEGQLNSLLTWETPAELAPTRGSEPAPEWTEEELLPVPVENLPAPCEGGEPFAFISYKRRDLERVAAIMRLLEPQGWRLWYDRGIPGGEDWNAMLEDRLRGCAGVVMFVSQAAVDSRWVRREVQFADGLDKPIVAVELEPAELRHGLGLLLGQYQRLSAGSADLAERLGEALGRILGPARPSEATCRPAWAPPPEPASA